MVSETIVNLWGVLPGTPSTFSVTSRGESMDTKLREVEQRIGQTPKKLRKKSNQIWLALQVRTQNRHLTDIKTSIHMIHQHAEQISND